MSSNLINRDFKSLDLEPRRRPLRRKHVHAVAAVVLSLGATALLWPGPDAKANREDPEPIVSTAPAIEAPSPLTLPLELPELSAGSSDATAPPAATELPIAIAQPPAEEPMAAPGGVAEPAAVAEAARPEPEPKPPVEWQEVVVRRGDNLSAIFGRLGVSPVQLHELLESGKEAKTLTHILPGQKLRFDVRETQLQQLQVDLSRTESLLFTREADGFAAKRETRPVEVRLTHREGVIDSSLFAAGKEAGLSDRLIMELAGIFGWDVDFALDLRQGDNFLLIFEERYLDGERLGEGAIVAAEFVNRGEVYRALRFTDPSGNSDYFSPDGHSMRKAFLRSPVDFRRISSRFQPERYHPVLGKKRPHRGVDYAAATGTPIKASGDGKIIFRGWKGGYGRTIIIQHGGSYSTLYAHMSKYRSGLSAGSRVKQGQTIGYVGKSGLATGPHLHYEFRVNGVHRNPLTVKLPKAEPIPAKYRAAFDARAQELTAQLDVIKRTLLASSD